jgi:hypothetical protein
MGCMQWDSPSPPLPQRESERRVKDMPTKHREFVAAPPPANTAAPAPALIGDPPPGKG